MDKDWAYFLGLMWADGCVRLRESGVPRANLALKDREHVELVAQTFGFTGRVRRVSSSHEQWKASCGRVLAERLLEAGVIPLKSLLDPPLPSIPSDVYSHFARGLIDGDGCIGYYPATETHNTIQVVDLCGSPRAIRAFSRRMRSFGFKGHKIAHIPPGEETWIDDRKVVSQRPLSRKRFGKSWEVHKLLQWLYQDCGDLYLRRKKEIADSIPYGTTREFLEEHYEERGPTWCARELGVPRQQILSRAFRLGLKKKSERERLRPFFEENYPTKGPAWCAQELGKSVNAVHKMAKSLGIRCDFRTWEARRRWQVEI